MQNGLVKTPMYQQLNELLRELIRSREFAVGEQFITEREVCERFQVSRATANKALSNLVAEGVLEFRKGVGTFVRGGGLDYDQRSLVSFTQKALAAGKSPSTQVLQLENVFAHDVPPEVQTALGVHGDDPLTYIERLRLADATPVILEHRYVVSRYFPDPSRGDLEGSLYSVWTEKYKLTIIGADQVIRAISVRSHEARHLDVPSGAAALLVISTGYLSGGVPLWWERTLYRGDAYEFHNHLGPIQTARPAAGALR